MTILENYEDGFRLEELSNNTIGVDLLYPRSSRITTIEVGLEEVRAADSIRITYDFDRDGWVVLQASIFEWNVDDDVQDANWQEVVFIRAWSREKKKED